MEEIKDNVKFNECVCGSDTYKIFRDFGEHKVLECVLCGLYRSSPLPGESICSNSYQEVNSIQKLHSHQVSVLKSVIKLSNGYKTKILDVGCSTGSMLEYLQNKGYVNIKGIEVNNYAVQVCLSKKLDVKEMDTSNLKLDEEFDVIYLNHVLEHIGNLNDFISRIKNHLNPGGFILIAVPNIGGKGADSENWIGYQFEQHYWHFTPGTLEKIFTKNGFELYKFYTLSGGRLKSFLYKIFNIQGDSLVSIFKYA